MLSVVVIFMVSARSQHLTNLTYHGGSRFDSSSWSYPTTWLTRRLQ